MIKTDALIIGAGPTGLFTAHQLKLIGLDCEIVDNLDKIGGQCIELYPDKPIYDIPAVPECTGEELTNNLINQLKPFDIKFHLSERVDEVTKDGDKWIVKTNKGTSFTTPNVIIAGGVGSFEPRKFSVEGHEKFENKSILYSIKDKNIFITENKKNYLNSLAHKLKSEIVHHNNFIGGRYSVLSEVGMLPAELMGLNSKSFRQFNNLIKNQKYLNALISNVGSTINLIKKRKFNSIIINYDEKSQNFFSWYQQLVAESLGKKGKGLLPVVSNMPRDNHSVMQLYLDGFKNNFYTFFYVHENNTPKIDNKFILPSQNFLKNKNIQNITYAQKKATENVFTKKNIPFRSFEIKKRDEKTLGELFCFFMLETILIGRALKINPYNQPAVELIKKETKKILV